MSAFDADLGDEGLQENFAHRSVAVLDGVSDSGAHGSDLIRGRHGKGVGGEACFEIVAALA